jgi:hypothetical protein
MKPLAPAIILCGLILSGTSAADQTCKTKATKEKLTGGALVSFVKQCETDAYLACVQAADDKKLVFQASDNFVDSCVVKALGDGPRWCVPHYCEADSDCTGGTGCGVCWAGLCGN